MSNVLINCLDVVGESMAGPAIRSWEFASQLSKNHNVVVLTPNKSSLKPKEFKLVQHTKKSFATEVAKADILISQTVRPNMAKIAKKHNTRIIIDAYDPITIEALEALSKEKYSVREAVNKIILLEQSASFCFADSVICASEKQRDYWLGVLVSMNKVTPSTYDKDNSLRNLIDVVPFGLSEVKPIKSSEESLRQRFRLKDSDFVLLWGGGLWNWFDPLSLIEAVNKVKNEIPVKLVFYGIDHPNKGIPRSTMTTKAINRSDKLGLTDKSVFFKEGWVPYKQRQQFLLDADVGLSTHFDHLETRFSFRTRILDYIWAELPIIATQGDSFSVLVEENNLGIVVKYNDVDSIADAIKELYTDTKGRQEMKVSLRDMQKEFYWKKCVEPIENMISYWSINEPEKSLKINTISINLTGLYGGHKDLAKKVIKKFYHSLPNKATIGNLYRSQDIIRRKSIKKLLGIK